MNSNGGNTMVRSEASGKNGGMDFNASWSSSVYQDNAHVVPNSVKTKYFIKYQ